MARRGIRLPYDGRQGSQQVGIFETADADDVAGAPLYKKIILTTSSGTGNTDQVTIEEEGRYSLKSDIDFHIEVTMNPEHDAPDVTTGSPPVESTERIITYYTAGTKIKARRAGATDGTLWITPH